MTLTYERRSGATAIALIGDGPRALERARRIADLCGLAVRGDGLLGEVGADVAEAGLCLVELDGAATDATLLADTLARIETAVAAGRMRAIVAFPPELIDGVAAALPSGAVELLCRPSEAERVAAVRLALAAPGGGVAEDGEADAERLRAAGEELERIARLLVGIGERGLKAQAPAEPVVTAGAARLVKAADVRRLIRARRLRDQFLPAGLFADPAWDMLLDLTAARLEGRPVAVSSLCIAAAVPPTTALRWIRLLTHQGQLVRSADPLDGRRVFMTLSDATADAMLRYVAALQQLDLMAA